MKQDKSGKSATQAPNNHKKLEESLKKEKDRKPNKHPMTPFEKTVHQLDGPGGNYQGL